MAEQLAYHIKKGAARIILCSALAISAMPMTTYASSGDSGRLLEAQFEDQEGFRLFRYRMLKALNTLRDAGMTPQAIAQTITNAERGGADGESADARNFANVTDDVSDYASHVAQGISDEVQERTQEIVQDATDAATEAARQQMNNWVDSLGESIGKAIHDAIGGVLGTESES